MGVSDWTSWQDRHNRPREKVSEQLEKTLDVTVKPWKYDVKESRLSDTGINRLRGLTRGKT